MNDKKLIVATVLKEQYASKFLTYYNDELAAVNYNPVNYQTLEQFSKWYMRSKEEACLVTDLTPNDRSYIQLIEDFPALITIIFKHEKTKPFDEENENVIQFDSDEWEFTMDRLLPQLEQVALDIQEKHDNQLNSDESTDNEEAWSVTEDNEPPPEDEYEQPEREDIEFVHSLNDKQATREEKQPEPNMNEAIKKTAQMAQTKTESIPDLDENDAKTIAEQIRQTDMSINYQVNPYRNRSRNIQKNLSGPKMEGSKVIGVWSPLPVMGVTSFVINYSLFLAEQKVHTAVLESITTNHILKDWLKRYSSPPDKWMSFAKALHTDGEKGDSEWTYKGVTFFPLERDDAQLKWNAYSLEAYMITTKIFDITLVDMPTGQMEAYTEESLQYLDELWIVVDDRVQQLNSWKKYIAALIKKYNVPIYMIHNKIIPASKPHILTDDLETKMIAEIPALWTETATNYYQNKPLYLQKETQAILKKPYHQLAIHLFGPSFQLHEKQASSWEPFNFFGKFQKILNG